MKSPHDKNETARLAIVKDIVQRKDATTEQFLTLVTRMIDNPDQRIFRTGYDLPKIAKEEEFAKADLRRERRVSENEALLSKIDPAELIRLTNKLRPMVGEIALPLRRSADGCYLGDAANDNAYVRMDAERVAQVTSKRIDDNEIIFRGILRSYDRYTYRGKIESEEFDKTMYYSVELDNRATLPSKILTALGNREVEFSCATYRDAANHITSLILRDINV